MSVTGLSSAVRRWRAPRWMVIALITSLALNLLVAGWIGAAVWRARSMAFAGHANFSANLRGYANQLPAERRSAIWANTTEERNQIRAMRGEVRMVREEVLRVLSTEPFDKQRFTEAQARLFAAENKVRDVVQRLNVEIATRMTLEERQSFIHWREPRRSLGQGMPDERSDQPAQSSRVKQP
jgi:uncharacterized membrane protein